MFTPKEFPYAKCLSWSILFFSIVIIVNRAMYSREVSLKELAGLVYNPLFTLPHFIGKLNHLFVERFSPQAFYSSPTVHPHPHC